MKSKGKIITAFVLIAIAITERLWFDLGPNVELVTMAAILAAIYLGRNYALLIPLIILGLTDMKLGNSSIMFFTWSAFIIEGLSVYMLGKRLSFGKLKYVNKLFAGFGFGIGCSLFFYLWTNFGVWFLGSFAMYPKNLQGLTACYIAGLPFLKYSLITNLFFVPAGVLTLETIISFKYLLGDLYSKNLSTKS